MHELEELARLRAVAKLGAHRKGALTLLDEQRGAALEGGVDVSGFQASLNDQLVSDELVLRPSSSILNYHIIQEAAEGSHYQVRIKAAVGALPKRNCQHRPISHATLFAPTIQF